MPSKRTWAFLVLAVLLYFLANQTQVGWVYVMTAGILGLLAANFFYSRRLLAGIKVQRTFKNLSDNEKNSVAGKSDLTPDSFHEDDPIEITLHVQQTGLRPAFLIHGDEVCPFAPPEEQKQPVFIPHLFKQQAVQAVYTTVCDRRGLHRYGPLPLRSRGPFDFFQTRHTVAAPAEILIYPAYHRLQRLHLLETRELAERQTARVGLGTEVVGTREYRPGDSLRQIHWRSTARIGRLVVKEFAEEDQPSLTVMLDLETTAGVGREKYSTFETAIRVAASLGYYATRHDVPFRLAGSSPKWRAPASPLSWWAMLNYLAKVQNDGQESLARVLETLPPLPFLVVLVSRPTPNIIRAIHTTHQKGSRVLALFITPDGAIPPEISPAGAAGLEIAGMSPYNWVEVLEKL